MYAFFVTVHARPPGVVAGPTVSLRHGEVPTLDVPRDALSSMPMGLSFEEAAARLGKLERMFCEPDGSLVWVSPGAEPAWQVDGNLFDRQGRLLFVDLKGTCPAEAFDQLLTALGWPQTKLVFQLTREAIFLDEEPFRRYAEAQAHGAVS